MTNRQFVDSKGNTWEWEETDEVRAAVERLHADIRELARDRQGEGGLRRR